jgi:hypothetical protein
MCANHLTREQAEDSVDKIFGLVEDLDAISVNTNQEALIRSIAQELIKLRDGYINVHATDVK